MAVDPRGLEPAASVLCANALAEKQNNEYPKSLIFGSCIRGGCRHAKNKVQTKNKNKQIEYA